MFKTAFKHRASVNLLFVMTIPPFTRNERYHILYHLQCIIFNSIIAILHSILENGMFLLIDII